MKKEGIIEAVKKAKGGSGKVRITFRPEATRCVVHLLAMDRGETIKIDKSDKIELRRVPRSRRWTNDNSRTTVIKIGRRFNQNDFIEKMMSALESIEVA